MPLPSDKIPLLGIRLLKKIKGEQKVTSVLLKDVKTGVVREQAFGGTFIYVGLDPVSDFATELGILDENGWVVRMIIRNQSPRYFMVGDVRQKDLRHDDSSRRLPVIAGQEVINIPQKT